MTLEQANKNLEESRKRLAAAIEALELAHKQVLEASNDKEIK